MDSIDVLALAGIAETLLELTTAALTFATAALLYRQAHRTGGSRQGAARQPRALERR